MRSVVAMGGSQSNSSEGDAFALSSWGWVSGSVCAMGPASGSLLCLRIYKPSGVSWKTMFHFGVCSGDHWWGSLCSRWRVTSWPHLQLW